MPLRTPSWLPCKPIHSKTPSEESLRRRLISVTTHKLCAVLALQQTFHDAKIPGADLTVPVQISRLPVWQGPAPAQPLLQQNHIRNDQMWGRGGDVRRSSINMRGKSGLRSDDGEEKEEEMPLLGNVGEVETDEA